jgi:hypothetical protein
MLEVGAIILTISSGVTLIMASFTLALVLILKKNAPIISSIFNPDDLSGIDPRVISAMNSYAILFNACAASFSLLMLFVIWSSLINEHQLAFFILLITAGLGQIVTFKADAAIGTKLIPLNIILSVLFLVGIASAGFSIFFVG